ncbi:hypothetical protein SSPNP10_15910 [Streptomyces sp. NP10]|uniref:hypothetical protein n=1 Tax=Streptomyces sp. NP10 TaxID=1141731 RepID=UPI000F899F49|nr:hypothetical protein [Streptomyces sp. NP10]RUP66747.1 hypothetical protein SSPNP10_15910 [Streptomyces sp. NP10]
MSALPIDTMPAEDLAIHLMTSAFALTGGEPEARRLLDELRTKWAAEDADAIVAENDRRLWASTPGQHWAADLIRRRSDPTKATRMQDANEALTNCKEHRHG